jgi:ankyrin repeat protein
VVSDFGHFTARLSKTTCTALRHLPANVCVVGLGQFPLSSGLDINLLDQNGRTPLHIASQLGDEALGEEFANKMSQKEIGKVDIGGFTALRLAKGNEAIVRTLLDKKPPNNSAWSTVTSSLRWTSR